MAANDAEVDTSTDSNDLNLVTIPNILFSSLANFFEKNEDLPSFALPQPVSTTVMNDQKLFRARTHCSDRKSRRQCLSGLYHYNQYRDRKLRLAASTCNIELLTRLLKSGMNPNCADEHKRSPLHLAACRGYSDIVSQLLKYGANPNIIDSLGNTPLHLAVILASSTNFNLVVRILLQHGASVHIVDRSGKNPLQLAEASLRLLRSRNPKPEIKTIEDMCLLVAVILRYFCKQKKDLDDITAIEQRLKNLTTEDQVVNEADSLLASVEKLSIAK